MTRPDPATRPTHLRLGRWVCFTGVLAASAAGLTTFAASASAHDAPPAGSASCTNGASSWQVADGTTRVENTGGAQWQLTFATTSGTIQAANATGTGDTGTGPGFTVTDIPSSIDSITVTTTTHWGTPPAYTDGAVDRTVTIQRPEGGCAVQVEVPAGPGTTPATCTQAAVLTVPADTATVHWTVSPTYRPGDSGSYALTATAQAGAVFTGSTSATKTYQVTVQPRTAAADCESVVTPIRPSSTNGSCTTPGQHTMATLRIPSTPHVQYRIAGGPDVSGRTMTEPTGTTVRVVATPAPGYRFHGAQSVTSSITLTSPGGCTVVATPIAPALHQSACAGHGVTSTPALIIPAHVVGVRYRINGTEVTGTIAETGATTVVVSAAPASGYVFAASATTRWTEHFAGTPSCPVTTVAETTPTPVTTALANTGVPIGVQTGGGVLILALGLALSLAGRRRGHRTQG